MTILSTPPPPAGTDTESGREAYRRQLAELLDRDPAMLPDSALLLDDLALDSLAMMSLLTWLESRGVLIATDRHQPASVGDVLALLDRAAFPGLSIRVTDGADAHLGGPTEVTARPRPPTDPLVPVLSSHLFQLTPIQPDDIGFLYTLAVQPETCFRWRYRGAPPPFDRFTADLWKQVLVQYVVRRAEDSQPVGHVVAYGADPGLRYLYLGTVFQPRYAGTGLAAHAAAVFARSLFHTFPLHKIYLEVPGFNWSQVCSGKDRFFRVEGVLRDHSYYAGRSWDEYLCAIYPEQCGDVW